jgi:ureidoglycolate dehydrogenase (NAD+)
MPSESPISLPIISAPSLTKFCLAAMARSGVRETQAQITAQVLVTTDLWGTHTHGTKQLRPLMKNVRDHRIDVAAEPQVVIEGAGWALMDGHHAMPTFTAYEAMRLAISKARHTGIAYVGVRRSGHFGAAGYYACQAAQAGLIGLAFCNVDPGVTAPGARGSVLGTNPLAYAVPRGQGHPVFLDIATSAVAASKVYAAKALGQPIPDNWLVDENGVPTTDPRHYPQRGALLPMAGHKGYGLALLVEILSAVMTGAAIGPQVTSWVADAPEPVNQGHFFMAIDGAAALAPGEFGQRMDWLADYIHGVPKAHDAARIYLPGEMEWERYERATTQGLKLPADVTERLEALAADVGLSFADYCS